MEYRLGTLLAEGGEGRVYRLQGREDVLAKLYSEPGIGREVKLEHLIEIGNKRLLHVAAWPLSRLRDSRDETVGFVMESLEGWQPLHASYQVKSRLDQNPYRTWRHLVRIARNLAACVHHVHDAGLIVGDLNESNVLVSHESMVKLIDVDSFQCETADTLFTCHVAKPELLAPELHGKSLEGLRRSESHDDFALAVLIFQTLMFGRHPFAGRPELAGDISLEEAIQKGWYPFTERRNPPIAPPKGLEIDWVSSEIRDLFEQAFDPDSPDRPSAHAWFVALKTLEASLAQCSENQSHAFWHGLDTCPWCALEDRWNLALFQPKFGSSGRQSIDVDRLWARIEAVPEPRRASPPRGLDATQFHPIDTLATRTARAGTPWIPLVIVGAFNAERHPELFILVVAMVAFYLGCLIKVQFQHRFPYNRAQETLTELAHQWELSASAGVFDAEKEAFRKQCDALENSSQRLEIERTKRLRIAHQRELEEFLSRYSVRSLAGVLTLETTSAIVNTLGIQTAADIHPDAMEIGGLAGMEGFHLGPELTKALVAWRTELEDRFWSTSSFRLDPHMEREAQMVIAQENAELRKNLERAPKELGELAEQLSAAQIEIAREALAPVRVIQKHGAYVAALTIGKK